MNDISLIYNTSYAFCFSIIANFVIKINRYVEVHLVSLENESFVSDTKRILENKIRFSGEVDAKNGIMDWIIIFIL